MPPCSVAQARLLQLWSWFNYLGYSDDYMPPWRFQFLLDRARYFAEHAKNAQREYLNFLSNAEREEFQELTAAQTVELEKSNIHIESARVNQVRLEVAASVESAKLADLTASDAHNRLETYAAFDRVCGSAHGYRSNVIVSDGLPARFRKRFPQRVGTALENVPVIGGLFSSSETQTG